MIDSDIQSLRESLRRRVSALEGRRAVDRPRMVQLGHDGIDRRLEGGIERGRLHEIFSAEGDDSSSAAGFATMLALRTTHMGNLPLLWLRQEQPNTGHLHAPGLMELGLDPGRLILGVLPDPLALLRVAAEAARCAGLGVLVVEMWRNPRALDLTASRRLAVAAEASGVTALLLRLDAEPMPSAAQTRWSVRSAAAIPLEANAPGKPTLDIELLRQRGGRAGGCWRVEWDRDQAIFRAGNRDAAQPAPLGAPIPGLVVPLPARGPAQAAGRRAG